MTVLVLVERINTGSVDGAEVRSNFDCGHFKRIAGALKGLTDFYFGAWMDFSAGLDQ